MKIFYLQAAAFPFLFSCPVNSSLPSTLSPVELFCTETTLLSPPGKNCLFFGFADRFEFSATMLIDLMHNDVKQCFCIVVVIVTHEFNMASYLPETGNLNGSNADQGRSDHIRTYARAYLKNLKKYLFSLFIYRFIGKKRLFKCISFSFIVLLPFCIKKTLRILSAIQFNTGVRKSGKNMIYQNPPFGPLKSFFSLLFLEVRKSI